MRRRVVVTGIGCINPLGNDVETMWSALKEGKSGVGYTTIFDASQVPHQDLGRGQELGHHPGRRRRRSLEVPRPAHAVRRRRRQAGRGPVGHPRCGPRSRRGSASISAAAKGTRISTSFSHDDDRGPHGPTASTWPSSPRRAWKSSTRSPSSSKSRTCRPGYLAGLFNAQGPNANCLTACAASSQAIGEATEIIRRGDADVMLSGGTHSMIHPFGVTGFNLLTALSHQQRRADEGHRGRSTATATALCWAKGAAMVVLEELEHAKRRGATIYGEIIGYGTTADAYRITDIHPEGRGAIACMQMALADAGLNAADIRLHQRPRHQHRGERPRRNAGLQAGLRRAGLCKRPSPAPRA